MLIYILITISIWHVNQKVKNLDHQNVNRKNIYEKLKIAFK